MRPVNLIPPEERRGEAAPSRTGALAWLVVGGLAIAVLAVAGLVFTNKDISDKEAEITALEQTESELSARAASLAAFTNFQQIRDARTLTIAALAESRFDWARVMEELARVIPSHVWLVSLTGEVGEPTDAATTETGIAGPSLTMSGCARSQRAVAKMVSAIGDIDGVTRVTATKSEKPDSAVAASPAGGGGNVDNDDCRTRAYVPQFEIVAAFDGVAVPEGAAPAPAPAPEGTEPTPAGSAAEATEEVGAVQQARNEQAGDIADAEDKAKSAPGGGGGKG